MSHYSLGCTAAPSNFTLIITVSFSVETYPFRNDTLSAGQTLDFFIWACEGAERLLSPLSESEETQIQQRNWIFPCQCQHNNANKSAK